VDGAFALGQQVEQLQPLAAAEGLAGAGEGVEQVGLGPLTCAFAGIGVIVDRTSGARRELLAAPVPRGLIVAGNLTVAVLTSALLVNGAAGALFGTRQEPVSVLGFTVVDGRIAALDLIVNPAKLRRLRLES